MKLGPVTKIDKKNKTTSRKYDDDAMWENCDVTVVVWHNSHTIALSKGTIWPKNANFLQKMLTLTKLRGTW